MADDKRDMNATNVRGADWEVVSLTDSTYAASPGPQRSVPDEQHKELEFNKTEQDCTEAMFMSKHFVVLQEETENLPSECYPSDIHKEQSLSDKKTSGPHRFSKDKGKIDSDTELFDSGHITSDDIIEFEHGKQEEDPKLVEKEHALYFTPNYSNFDADVDMNLPIVQDDTSDLAEHKNSPEKLDHPSWRTHGCKPNEENKGRYDESHGTWWKERAMSVYNHVKGTNTIWSVFVAVAVAGLVILGQRWWREKSYFQQFKWKCGGTDEKTNKMAAPIGRYKVLVGGNHRAGSMREGLHPTY